MTAEVTFNLYDFLYMKSKDTYADCFRAIPQIGPYADTVSIRPLPKKPGNSTTGTQCQSIKKFADVDKKVLQELIDEAYN